MAPIIICTAIAYFMYRFLESLVRRKERIMLVEKLEILQSQSLQMDGVFNSAGFFSNKEISGLRIGLLLTGIGFGLVVAWVLTVTMLPDIIISKMESLGGEYWGLREMFKTIYLAAPALFGGLGLLLSYIVERKTVEREK